ncbi:flagellar hook-associated protein FlgK [Phosphitispora sp. TUW77]|uniref:flagellar hook-associated protein FlgK n=1 Tax=Phosphitispora sp. TUW77 TaxID=3152361 RepID=UPI003AB2D4F4
MSSTFFGLEIGRKALQVQQAALNVTGHNIANANTEGFTRQRAVMSATKPFAMPSFTKPAGAGQIGTGVEVQEIRRVRDDFIDLQLRKENNVFSEWEEKLDSLQKLEVVFNEPSESSLRTVLDRFWEAWQDLSLNPELEAVRMTVRESGVALAETFNHLDRQLGELTDDIDDSINIAVDEINNIATQIATLNDQIVSVEVQDDNANDLRDKRDLLVDELSKSIQVSVREDEYGSLKVSIGGRALVTGTEVFEISAVADPGNNGYVELQWADGSAVRVESGELKGMLDTRDTIVPSYQDQLDELARTVVVEMNSVHAAGYGLDDDVGGINFFDPIDPLDPTYPDNITAANIAVDDAIMNDLDNIAAASIPGDPLNPGLNAGDGSNAINIVELKHMELIGTATVDDYYNAMIAELGVQAREAERMTENQELLVTQLENRREQVSGVSLDEEMTNMIKFQHAYNAAARVVTAMDELLDTVVNRLGLVGR